MIQAHKGIKAKRQRVNVNIGKRAQDSNFAYAR